MEWGGGDKAVPENILFQQPGVMIKKGKGINCDTEGR